MLEEIIMNEEKVYTKQEIFAQLEEMKAPVGSIVLMHSSLRSVGAVEGGAKGLLDALIEYFTREGGLFCVPAHTWNNIGKEITLDMSTAQTCLGAFSKIAVEDQRGLRTENPTHSMVIFGDRARAERFAEHEADILTPTAPESCYGKLFSEDGYVLLVGVSQSRNTYLHSVAEILQLPDRMAEKPIKSAVRRTSGEVVSRDLTLYHTSFSRDISQRFIKYDTAFRYRRCITDGFIGNAPTQLCSARRMLETVKLIFASSGGIDPLADESPIPQKWYC